ncbi:hypothetical protein UG55_102529 [Frankia sp. EI5c]|nr:hypothetical protein UG55_102529 [Frankia sp. EI5c]
MVIGSGPLPLAPTPGISTDHRLAAAGNGSDTRPRPSETPGREGREESAGGARAGGASPGDAGGPAAPPGTAPPAPTARAHDR